MIFLAQVNEMVNANGTTCNAESERRALADRLVRLKKQLQRGLGVGVGTPGSRLRGGALLVMVWS